MMTANPLETLEEMEKSYSVNLTASQRSLFGLPISYGILRYVRHDITDILIHRIIELFREEISGRVNAETE